MHEVGIFACKLLRGLSLDEFHGEIIGDPSPSGPHKVGAWGYFVALLTAESMYHTT